MNPTPPKLTWTDGDNRTWSTAIKFDAAVRLRENAQIDLLDPKCVETIFGAGELQRVEAMAELYRDQWESLELTYGEFADALLSTETSFVEATAALRSALSDFFQRLGRSDLRTVADRTWKVMEMASKKREQQASGAKVGSILEAALAKSESETEEQLDAELAKIHGSTSGS